ncbi:glycosyl transferase [Roseibium sp. TrichSKD4]|uniref:class I SAM-dependent methyltransferase n=1 Tax=Roseibium sp. TrichSKD4 TaxID=744980 RepID=UPI0001E57785|nr:class I SAM-dependent methyltransferase [Roseibium sp. TrichSKD4]EFO29540.1 glycosyl transferase [Roseibium sp. TrichSKD4]
MNRSENGLRIICDGEELLAMDIDVIKRGGADIERLFLTDKTFQLQSGRAVEVRATDIPGIDMQDTIARHKARYMQVGLFCRPGLSVLDFPCGSGYGSEVLGALGVRYQGLDIDPISIEYAEKVYGAPDKSFRRGNLKKPVLPNEAFDIIGCIEGLEHIELEFQDVLVGSFHKALKSGGVLVVSSPVALSGVSGPNPKNPHHLGELTKPDFVALLQRYFAPTAVEIVTHRARLTTGIDTECLYGICHKR